jgi:predicted metal-binding membrane protein
VIIRFTQAPTATPCHTCCRSFRSKEQWHTAKWFTYFGNHNAVPLCGRHAIYELGCAWSLGDTIVVNGEECPPPAPLLAAFESEVWT